MASSTFPALSALFPWSFNAEAYEAQTDRHVYKTSVLQLCCSKNKSFTAATGRSEKGIDNHSAVRVKQVQRENVFLFCYHINLKMRPASQQAGVNPLLFQLQIMIFFSFKTKTEVR